MSAEGEKEYFVYAGTYTSKGSKGVRHFHFNAGTGELKPLGVAAELPSPTYLALHPQGNYLYAVNEIRDERGRRGGSISAFSISPETGALTFINRQPSRGTGPCHVNVDATGRCLLVANYVSGSLASFPITGNGGLGEAVSLFQHEGSSVNPERQEGPHAHSVTSSPDNRFVVAADLGLDKLFVYRLDPAQARLEENDPPFVRVREGAGPRHSAFHPNGKLLYVINELGNTIITFAWDAAQGRLRQMQEISTLPGDFKEESYCAAVAVAPSGRFVYGTNRLHDTIAIFEISEKDGTLSRLAHEPARGKRPWDFTLVPSGKWLIVANMGSDNITIFRVDPESGRLSYTGESAGISMPACVKLRAVG